MNFQNPYKVDLRELSFLLWEQFNLEKEILSSGFYPDFSREMIQQLLFEARNFAYKKLGPAYQASDREGCSLQADGRVRLPSAFPQLWQDYNAAQWGRLASPPKYEGLGAPYIFLQIVFEMFFGANPTFMTYSGFCAPAMYLIEAYGSEQLQQLFCSKLASNRWGACLCMTEADAGSDVGNVRTKALRQEDGRYLISGNKIFISAGMHDLAENIVYLVVARVEGAPAGTLGLSCFVVPRLQVRDDGTAGADNHVRCVRLEEKMGLHGCATAQLAFGDGGPCYGYLLGEKENIGLRQLLSMMNQARIATGIFALGMSSSAYLNAAEYAQQRVQGSDFRQSFNPRAPRIPIINHLDVKRMLLEMKSKVEGCRALIVKLSYHQTLSMQLKAQGDPDNTQALQKHEGLVNLLTPIVKAYTSDQAWRITELAIQVYGGHGYIADHPLEQYARDVKILSIWEGTNFIQSADLIRDKLAMGRNSKLLKLYEDEVSALLDKIADNVDFAQESLALQSALAALKSTHALLGHWVLEKKTEWVFGVSTRFLEMMAEVTLAWLLLDAAVIAQDALNQLDTGHPDVAFYRGKVLSARFFIGNILPGVVSKAGIIAGEHSCLMEADAAIFSERSQLYV